MFIVKMKTILSVGAFCVSILFMHIEANTDVEFHSILARLSLLEEKQASSDKRIAALEWENKLSQKRIKDLEKYKTYSDRRVVALERKNALCNRKNNELDILMKQYAHTVAIETDKLLSEKNNTMDGYDKTLSYREVTSFVNDKNRSDRTLAKPNGKDDKLTAADEMANRLTAVVQSEHRRFVAEGIVAFSAMKAAGQEHIGLNQNIIFEQVLTNEGGGYHPNHGVFTAPQSGVYVFSSSIMATANGEIHTAIVHNGNAVARMFAHSVGTHDQGSQTVVLRLNAGDEVAVQNIDISDDRIYGALYTSFSGYLLLQ